MKNNSLRLPVLVFGITLLFSSEIFAQEREERPRERPSIEQLFKDLDENEDGKLSKKEIKGPLKKDFDKIDVNEDGFLTAEELKKAPKPKRMERRQNN
ncbi:hypothetical protein MHTCC0001_22540 [Flavobacteriaceae bacterium MHTCC 0001]